MIKLDPRKFSQEAFTALNELKQDLQEDYLKSRSNKPKKSEEEERKEEKEYYAKASSIVRNINSYIPTWGLHRLSGDSQNYLIGKGEDNRYKGKIYQKFLQKLKTFSGEDFQSDQPATLIDMPLRKYTSLNRLAIELAREWSFWTPAVLGEPEEE